MAQCYGKDKVIHDFQIGELESKALVLESFPLAICVKEWLQGCYAYQIVATRNGTRNTLIEFIGPHTHDESIVWRLAWKSLQKHMLSKLEP